MGLSEEEFKTEFFDYNELIDIIQKQQMCQPAWKVNYMPHNDYTFPKYNKYIDKSSVDLSTCNKVEPKCNDFMEVLLNRKSTLLNSLDAIWNVDEVAFLLKKALGCRDENRYYKDQNTEIKLRYYPAGGALYMVDVYFYAYQVEGLEEGLYYFNANKESIYKIQEKANKEELDALFPMTFFALDKNSDTLERTALMLFLTCDYKVAFKKYGLLSHRLSLLEAGHMGQNIQLVAAALGKNTLPICGFLSDKVDQFIGVYDNRYEFTAYGLMLG